MVDFINSITPDFVKVNVTNSKNDSVAFEKKFPKNITIVDLKNKLEIVTGGNAATMELELYNGDNFVCKLNDNNKLVGFYPIKNGMRIHVIDNFLFAAENVEKFELTAQQYDQKQYTLKNFLKQNKLGKYNEEEMKKIEENRKKAAEQERLKVEKCTVGSRCRVTVKGQPHRLGTVMYNGPLDGKNGIFIGVKYDEPLGPNDGSFNGKRYFECQPKYGGFVQPSSVEVGDFPPEDNEVFDEI